MDGTLPRLQVAALIEADLHCSLCIIIHSEILTRHGIQNGL